MADHSTPSHTGPSEIGGSVSRLPAIGPLRSEHAYWADERAPVIGGMFGLPNSVVAAAAASGGDLDPLLSRLDGRRARGLALQLQRSVGNRAFQQRLSAHPPRARNVVQERSTRREMPSIQRQKVTFPPDPITGKRNWRAYAESLVGKDDATIEAELRKLSHEDRISLATAFYGTARTPGGPSTLALRRALEKVDAEAVRIGILNGNYDSAYREHNWHDTIMYLNAYSTEDIEKRISVWSKLELQEGMFQAREQFGPAGEARLGAAMLKHLPPPVVGPGTGPQLVALGQEAMGSALKALKGSAPVKVNGGVAGDVLLVPGATLGSKMLVSASPTGVYYTEGPGLFQMYAPDFVRDQWLTGFAAGAKRAEGMVRLAKLEFEILLAVFVPWYGVLGLTLLEALVTVDENRAAIQQLRTAVPTFMSARAEFKSRYPSLYDKFFWHCFWEVVKHIPEGVAVEDVAYFLGRVFGTQGIAGAFTNALKEGTKVTATTILKIVAEYAILVTILHAPSIVGRAAKAAAQKAGAEIKKGLAEVGIDVNDEEAELIAKELAGGASPDAMLQRLSSSAQEMADAMGKLEEYSKKHNAGF